MIFNKRYFVLMSVVLLQALSIKGAFTEKFFQLQISQSKELKECSHGQHYLAISGQKQDRVKLEHEMVQIAHEITSKEALKKFGLKFAEYCDEGADTENMEFATCALNSVIQKRGENSATHWYVSGIHDCLNAHIPGILIGGGEKYSNKKLGTPPLFVALQTSCALAKMLTQKHDQITTSDIYSYSMLKRYPLPVLRQFILWMAEKKSVSLCCEYLQIYQKRMLKRLREGEKISEEEQADECGFFNTLRAIAFYKKSPSILRMVGNWDQDLRDTQFSTQQVYGIYNEKLEKVLLKTGKNIQLLSNKIMLAYRTSTEHALNYFQAYMNSFEKSGEWHIDQSKGQCFMSLKELTNGTVELEKEVAKNMAYRQFNGWVSKSRVLCSVCAKVSASNMQLCPDAQCTATKGICGGCYENQLYLPANEDSCATCENFSHVDRDRLVFLADEALDGILKDQTQKAKLSKQQNTVVPQQQAQPAQVEKKITNIHVVRGGKAVRKMNQQAQQNNQQKDENK
jgi:hypothetical protein